MYKEVNRLIKWSAIIIIFFLICGMFPPLYAKAEIDNRNNLSSLAAETKEASGNNFIHASGQKLYDAAGEEFRIKSIGFGNNVWYTQKGIPDTDHDEQSYKELAELGFNSVRFYINAALFESDTTPYVYNEDAFHWLSNNIEWAKKYNIKLLINMHIPQGGRLGASNLNLWVKEGYATRFTALWKEIATRYADEETILGFGLMNEPFVPQCDTRDNALNLYYELINQTVTAIREVDQKHIMFVERPYGTVDTVKKQISYFGYTDSFRLLQDENTVYEFHFYDKNEYVFQELSWLNYRKSWYYNSDNIAILSGTRKISNTYISEPVRKYDATAKEWQYLESDYISPDEIKDNYGYWMLYISGLGKEGSLLADDIVVKEYDENGSFIRDLYQLDFNSLTGCDGWDMGTGGGGAYSYNKEEGHLSPGCAQITGVQNSYRIYKSYNVDNFFPLRGKYSYKICAYVKFVNAGSGALVKPALQGCHADQVYALDKDYLRSRFEIFTNWGQANNVPLFLGEFGIPGKLIGNEYRGEAWVSDMFDLLAEYNLGYCYHDYHEENFGLYTNDSRFKRTTRNEILYQLFKKYLT